MTLSITDAQHNKTIPLCSVSRFICCYAECHYAECHYAQRHYADCPYVECCFCKCWDAGYTNKVDAHISVGMTIEERIFV